MDEYIIENKTNIAWQKHLNQWRHDYKLEIIKAKILNDGTVTMILKRTK